MASRLVNTGRNKAIDLFVQDAAEVEEIAVGDDGTTASVSDTSVGNELERYTPSNERRATGEGRFAFTIPDTSSIDDETLREVGLQVDVADADEMVVRIDFAETPKSQGSKLEFEVDGTVTNV